MRKNSAKLLNKVKYENLFFKKCSLINRKIAIKNILKIEILGKERKTRGANNPIGTAWATFFEVNSPKI